MSSAEFAAWLQATIAVVAIAVVIRFVIGAFLEYFADYPDEDTEEV